MVAGWAMDETVAGGIGHKEPAAVLGATLKGLLARRARLVMTAVAVLTGVALVTGTLVLTDAVGRSVRRLTAGARSGVDVVVHNADDPAAGPPQAIRPDLVDAIAAAPGVEAVSSVVVGEKVTMVGRDGRPLRQPTRRWRPGTRCGWAGLPSATARPCWTRQPPVRVAGGWETPLGSWAPTACCTASRWWG
jgi:hypothetical protein